MKFFMHRKKTVYFVLVLFLMLVSTLFLEQSYQGNAKSVKVSIITQFLLFIVLFLLLGYTNKSCITLYSVFLILFYVFQNGQLLLYAFNVKANKFVFVEKFSLDQLHKGVLFSNLCMFSAFAAAIFSFHEKKTKIIKKLDSISPKSIYSISFIGLALTAIIAYILIGVKVVVWLRGGYSSVMQFETKVPSMIGVFEALFPAFCILSLISGVKAQLKTRYILALFILWGMVTAVLGDRTTGMGVIVILLLMLYFGYFPIPRKIQKMIFYFGCLMVVLAIPLIFSLRNHEKFSFGSIFQVIIDVVYELGFSFFPLQGIIELCPSTHNYLWGKSLLSSVVTGFFPESLDVFGWCHAMRDGASLPVHWIADRYQYGFGMDCSLNAEMYANFGMWGFLAMFLVCSLISFALKKVDHKSNQNVFSQYIGFALLFGWFTLPRRRSYYIYNKIFWYVIGVAAFIGIFYVVIKKIRGIYERKK